MTKAETASGPATSPVPAVGAVGAGALAGLVLAPTAVGLTREQLRISCGTYPAGSEGEGMWSCTDGVGYLWVAVAFGGITIISVLLGLVAAAARSSRVARAVLTLSAAIAAGGGLGLTWYGSSELVGLTPPGEHGVDYWCAAVLPAAVACGVGVLAAIVGATLNGRPAVVTTASAAGCFAVATVLQPGLCVCTLPAVGLLAAAAIRTGR